MAAVFSAVEQGAAWPAPLRETEVVLLPKPKGAPGDRRPVCLLPVGYRLWAAARRGPVDVWRAAWSAVGLSVGPWNGRGS